MMQRLALPIVVATLLYTGALGAQTPAPKAPATPARQQNPNPGQGGVTPGDYPSRPELTPEQQADEVKRQAAHVVDMQAEAFGRQMKLRPDQIAKLRPILVQRQKELQAIASADGDVSPEQRTKAMQIQAETQTKIKGLLDPQQRAQYEHLIELRNAQSARRSAMSAARRAQMRQNAPGAPAAPDAAPGTPAPAAPDAAPAPETAPPAPATPPAAPQKN
jgi:hypothetical protein